jgi:hypothetical protein
MLMGLSIDRGLWGDGAPIEQAVVADQGTGTHDQSTLINPVHPRPQRLFLPAPN